MGELNHVTPTTEGDPPDILTTASCNRTTYRVNRCGYRMSFPRSQKTVTMKRKEKDTNDENDDIIIE